MVDKLGFSDPTPATQPQFVSGDANWREYASCKDPALLAVFYAPDHFESKDDKQDRERQAKEICATCVVVVPCLEEAIVTHDFIGVRGRMGEKERREYSATRRRV